MFDEIQCLKCKAWRAWRTTECPDNKLIEWTDSQGIKHRSYGYNGVPNTQCLVMHGYYEPCNCDAVITEEANGKKEK